MKILKTITKGCVWVEIKRKKISDAEILQAERKLADDVSALCAAHTSEFEALGYELDLEFGQKEDEAQTSYSELVTKEDKSYDAGYYSRALITVRRKKTEQELAEDARLAEENRKAVEAAQAPEEAEQLSNDETLRVSEDALKRSVAFTEVMLVRTYKSFWTEWVSICDSLADIESDLSEFLSVLKEQ